MTLGTFCAPVSGGGGDFRVHLAWAYAGITVFSGSGFRQYGLSGDIAAGTPGTLQLSLNFPSPPTLAANDYVEMVWEQAYGSWSPNVDTFEIAAIAAGGLGGGGYTVPYVTVFFKDNDDISMNVNGGTGETNGTAAWSQSYRIAKLKFLRSGAAECKGIMSYWNGSGWTDVLTVTDAEWTATSIKGGNYGCSGTVGKAGTGTFNIGIGQIAYNETPSITAVGAHLLPNADGGTLQWTATPGATHYTGLDDAFGSSSTADYISAGTVADLTEDYLGVENFSPSASSILYVQVGHTYKTNPAAVGDGEVALRLSGVNSTAVDMYSIPASGGATYVFGFATDPSGGAWSTTDVDNIEIVERQPAASTRNIEIAAVGLSVLYEPAAAATTTVQGQAVLSGAAAGVSIY